MHELSLMNDTVAVAIAHAQAEGASKIHRIILQVGDRSGVVDRLSRRYQLWICN